MKYKFLEHSDDIDRIFLEVDFENHSTDVQVLILSRDRGGLIKFFFHIEKGMLNF